MCIHIDEHVWCWLQFDCTKWKAEKPTKNLINKVQDDSATRWEKSIWLYSRWDCVHMYCISGTPWIGIIQKPLIQHRIIKGISSLALLAKNRLLLRVFCDVLHRILCGFLRTLHRILYLYFFHIHNYFYIWNDTFFIFIFNSLWRLYNNVWYGFSIHIHKMCAKQ